MPLQEVTIDVMREIKKNSLSAHLKEDKIQPELNIVKINEELLNILKIMSHDLRGSLISILAILKLLDRGYYGSLEESVKIKLKEIFEKVNVLIGMTEEYLSRAFSVNEDLEAEHEVLDLRQDIINPILREFSSELKERHIEIENRSDFNSSKDQILLKGSRIWLKAVFRNLLMNAIHYGEIGGVVAFDFKKEGSMYRVKIYNSGKPVQIECRNKLFTKFSNNRDNSEGYNGMGIGLSLVKMIIQKHGGDIWYEAKEHGSNFIMTIPALN